MPGEEDSSTTCTTSPGCPDVDRHQAGDLPQPADHQEEAEQARAELGEARHVLMSPRLGRGWLGWGMTGTAAGTRCDPNMTVTTQHLISLGTGKPAVLRDREPRRTDELCSIYCASGSRISSSVVGADVSRSLLHNILVKEIYAAKVFPAS